MYWEDRMASDKVYWEDRLASHKVYWEEIRRVK
jgi:hypothetical protein